METTSVNAWECRNYLATRCSFSAVIPRHYPTNNELYNFSVTLQPVKISEEEVMIHKTLHSANPRYSSQIK